MSAKVIFTHKGNIVACYISQGKQNTCYLKAKSYKIAKDRISFEQVPSAKLSVKCSSNEVCLLICKPCRDVNTGLVLPMFTLLRRTPDKHKEDILYVIALEQSNRLVTINRVCVHKEWRFDKIDLYMIEGPSVVWTHQTNLYIASNQNVHKYDFMVRETDSRESTVLWCGVVNKKYLMIGVSSNKPKDHGEESMDTEENDCDIMGASSKFFVFCASIDSRNGNHLNFDALNEHDFISAAYSQNIEKLIMLKLEKNTTSHDAKICSRQYHSHMILCLSNQYCVEIKNGTILRCVHLPQLLTINHVALMTRFNDDRYIIATSKDNAALAINVQTLKIIETWSNSAYILVDDFMSSGTDQLFVAMGMTTTWPPSQWVLTDFHAHHIDQTSETTTDDTADDDSTNVGTTRAVRALEFRLQDDIIAVEEMKAAYQAKSQFLLETQQNLERMSLGLELPPLIKQPDMVTIVNSSEKAASRVDHSHRENAVAVEVSDPWQRILADKWIIGVDVRNISNRILYDLKLSAVPMTLAVTSYPENSVCSCHWPTDHLHMCLSQINREQRDNTSLELYQDRNSEVDEQLSPLSRTIVACFSSVEMFSDMPSVDYMLVLSWQEQEENDCSTREQRCDASKFWCITRMSPTIEDVMRESTRISFNVKESATDTDSRNYDRNIIAANLVQKSLSLLVQTSQTRLSTLSSVLIRAGFNQHSLYGCLVGTGVLENARIYIQTRNARASVLIVFARNEQQLLMLVHHLYSNLPDDVVIFPQKEAATRGLCHAAAKCLQEEIDYSVSSLKELVKSSETPGRTDTVAMDTDVTGDIQSIRDEFVSKKVMLNERKLEKVKVEKMVEFQRTLFAYQRQTDRAVGKLNKT